MKKEQVLIKLSDIIDVKKWVSQQPKEKKMETR
jgi:hypothetical protein